VRVAAAVVTQGIRSKHHKAAAGYQRDRCAACVDDTHQHATVRRVIHMSATPPDAEGNPACYYADGWRGNASGAGIEVWYFHEPQSLSSPDKVTALVRKKDGTNESQDADIAAGQQAHRFEFPAVDGSAVQEVLLTTGTGRCFVIGPGA
jgi:hypothetical protein